MCPPLCSVREDQNGQADRPQGGGRRQTGRLCPLGRAGYGTPCRAEGKSGQALPWPRHKEAAGTPLERWEAGLQTRTGPSRAHWLLELPEPCLPGAIPWGPYGHLPKPDPRSLHRHPSLLFDGLPLWTASSVGAGTGAAISRRRVWYSPVLGTWLLNAGPPKPLALSSDANPGRAQWFDWGLGGHLVEA